MQSDYRYQYHGPLDPVAVARARRAASRIGWTVYKSRDRTQHINNRGGLQLVNGNEVIAGQDYNLSPDQVLAFIATAKTEE